MENEDIYTDLKVISMIKENGRLCIRNGHLSIEPQLATKENKLLTLSAYASLAIRRWWNQDNRYNALLKVQAVVMKCHDMYVKVTENERKLLSKICHEAAIGLSNLQKTYEHDAAIHARLSVYINNLNDFE